MHNEISTNDRLASRSGEAAGQAASQIFSEFVNEQAYKHFDGKNPGPAGDGGVKSPALGKQFNDSADSCLPHLNLHGSDGQPPQSNGSNGNDRHDGAEATGKKRFHQDNEPKEPETFSNHASPLDRPHMVHPFGSAQGLNGEWLPNATGL